MSEYSVTVEAFGHIRTWNFKAESRREAEEQALREIGFSVASKLQPIQNGVYVGPEKQFA